VHHLGEGETARVELDAGFLARLPQIASRAVSPSSMWPATTLYLPSS
jgi:hypothetical protein